MARSLAAHARLLTVSLMGLFLLLAPALPAPPSGQGSAFASPTGRKVILVAGTNTYCTMTPCLDETGPGSKARLAILSA